MSEDIYSDSTYDTNVNTISISEYSQQELPDSMELIEMTQSINHISEDNEEYDDYEENEENHFDDDYSAQYTDEDSQNQENSEDSNTLYQDQEEDDDNDDFSNSYQEHLNIQQKQVYKQIPNRDNGLYWQQQQLNYYINVQQSEDNENQFELSYQDECDSPKIESLEYPNQRFSDVDQSDNMDEESLSDYYHNQNNSMEETQFYNQYIDDHYEQDNYDYYPNYIDNYDEGD